VIGNNAQKVEKGYKPPKIFIFIIIYTCKNKKAPIYNHVIDIRAAY
jgi:hypothetical protein